MDKHNWFYKQLVTEGEMDEAFGWVEDAINQHVSESLMKGIWGGLGGTQQAIPDLTVQVSAGAAYDLTGKRIELPALQTVSVANDYLAAITAVTILGEEKWVAVCVKYAQILTDPRVDGNALTVQFDVLDSIQFVVRQGPQAIIGTAPRATIAADEVRLFDVNLIFGQTTVLNADIDTLERDWTFKYVGTTRSLENATPVEAIFSLAENYDRHVSGLADRHPATQVDYAGTTAWLDGVTNPAATVGAQLTKLKTDLSDQSATDGAGKIGAEAFGVLTLGTVRSQLNQLASFLKIVAIGTNAGASDTNATTTYEDVGTYFVDIPGAQALDTLIIFAQHSHSNGGAPVDVYSQLAVTENAGPDIAVKELQTSVPATVFPIPVTLIGVRTIGTSGTVRAKVRLKSGTDGISVTVDGTQPRGSGLIAVLVR